MSPLTLCALVLAIGSLCSCADGSATLRSVCRDEVKLNLTELKALPPTDTKKKCYHACRYERHGLISNGKFVGKTKSCQALQDDNKCELGFKVFGCLQQARRQRKRTVTKIP